MNTTTTITNTTEKSLCELMRERTNQVIIDRKAEIYRRILSNIEISADLGVFTVSFWLGKINLDSKYSITEVDMDEAMDRLKAEDFSIVKKMASSKYGSDYHTWYVSWERTE